MNLNKNQKILAGAVMVVVLIGLIFVYQNAAEDKTPSYGTNVAPASPEPVPRSVDGITDAIIDETMADQAALDREAAGEDAEIQKDSQSVNDLSNSYDENSY